jgi:hypothetical protein
MQESKKHKKEKHKKRSKHDSSGLALKAGCGCKHKSNSGSSTSAVLLQKPWATLFQCLSALQHLHKLILQAVWTAATPQNSSDYSATQ